jgi:hypothetical protein
MVEKSGMTGSLNLVNFKKEYLITKPIDQFIFSSREKKMNWSMRKTSVKANQ